MTSDRKSSDHFANGRFFTPGAPTPKGLRQLLRWMRLRKRGYWPKFVETKPGPKPVERVPGDDLIVTFVNHSTFLLQTAGLNLLTDPVWSERVSPFRLVGPRRHRKPGLRFDDLPPIDAILISHNHYDHLDLRTLRRLAKRHRPEVFCPLGVAPLLRRAGLTKIHELDWWEHVVWRGTDVHCVPAQHFSSRTPFDRDRTLWCGWIFGPPRGQICFAGDTGFGPHFAEIARRFPELRLALLPIGAFEPEWFMGPVHESPEEAVEAHRILRAGTSIASHFGTFSLADDSMVAPVDRLRRALLDRPSETEFLILEEGVARSIPALAQALSS